MTSTTVSPAPRSADGGASRARVVQLLDTAGRGLTGAEARAHVRELAAILPEYFRDEEGSVFAEVLEVRPDLGSEVARFACEHVALGEQLRALALRMPDDGATPPEIPQVLEALLAHERAESELLVAVWQRGDGGAPD